MKVHTPPVFRCLFSREILHPDNWTSIGYDCAGRVPPNNGGYTDEEVESDSWIHITGRPAEVQWLVEKAGDRQLFARLRGSAGVGWWPVTIYRPAT